jgi:ribosome-binding protein aMBF1 (putative translation factor)
MMPAHPSARCERCGDELDRPPLPRLEGGGLTLCLGCAHPAYAGDAWAA